MEKVDEVGKRCHHLLDEKSMCVSKWIGYNDTRMSWWQKTRDAEKLGITFDVYDAGIAFFDKKMNKQHYIVNF